MVSNTSKNIITLCFLCPGRGSNRIRRELYNKQFRPIYKGKATPVNAMEALRAVRG
jgi:hypothetical protein